MRILQSGMPKSGNFWLWQMLQESIKSAGLPNESFIQRDPIYPIAKGWELSFKEQAEIDVLDISPQGLFYRISNIFRMPIDDLDAYLGRSNHIWTHSNFNESSKTVFPKFDKIVYILRDPRDVILSQSRFAFTPYRQRVMPNSYETPDKFIEGRLTEMSERWRKHVGQHLLNRETFNIHIIFYERLLHDFDTEYASLLDYLGINLSQSQIVQIKSAVQFETMQQANPNHLRKGQSYKWMEQFKPEQQKRSRAILGDLLELLAYPLSPEDGDKMPNLDAANPERLSLLLKPKKKPFFKRAVRRVIRLLD